MRIPVFLVALAGSWVACAQAPKSDFDVKEVERIERTLAADDMQGRKAGTGGSEKAAGFIGAEFEKAGLQPLSGNSFLQSFAVIEPKLIEAKVKVNEVELDPKNVLVITPKKEVKINEKSAVQTYLVKKGDHLFTIATEVMAKKGEQAVVFVDTSFSRSFSRLSRYRSLLFSDQGDVAFVLTHLVPVNFTIKAEQAIKEVKLANVVGVLPGKSKKGEYVIFSGHYDHLGIGKPQNGDSIYNGANDDAAGVTAVIMLANYYKKLNTQERTLVFAAFTAEEIGGFGSEFFSRQLPPEQIVAMLNIEMIGTESKWGKNAAFITGYDKSDLGALLAKNLQGHPFTFYPDPYPAQQLFYRSDNATLARVGVPAHTVSTAKMDAEKYYHSVDDEVETLDLENMAQIIRAIAHSAVSIVNGKDTPRRVEVQALR